MIKNIALFIVLLITFLIFKNYPIVTSSIIEACELFLTKIFPSLFPMFIISSILINLNLIKYINFIFKKINTKLFKLNENTSYILFMSMISGFPSNAKIAKEMYDASLIDKNDVQKIILFSHFSNPLFIMSMIKHKTFLVLLAHYLSNFIIGVIVRNKYTSKQKITKTKNKNKNFNISQMLSTSINQTMTTLLFILGTVVCFYILSSIIDLPIFNVILELSQGLNYLNILDMNIKLKTILYGCLLSFGGVCIHFQVYGILSDLKIKYLPYLLSRIFHALLTGFFILIFY